MSIVNYNYAANAASNVINRNEKLMDRTMAKLSSGTNIGVGSNEPGKLGAYNTVKSQATAARTGLASINMALAEMKLVESIAMTMNSMLTRMQELAVGAANTSVQAADRYAMDAEFGGIIGEFVRLQGTQFNGTAAAQSVMTGGTRTIYTGSGAAINIAMDNFAIDGSVATTGALLATGQILAGTNQSGAGATASIMTAVVNAAAAVPATRSETITTAAFAALSVAKLANIVPHFSGAVSRVGSLISRLEYAQEVTAATAVSFEAAASVIGDTDYAIETSKLASSQVISQAATAILAQANARTSTVLTLLK